jgi:DNA (cytosine-5)-methyltransferase 1
MIGGFEYVGKRYSKLPFKIVKAVDNDPFCTRIYNANFETPCEIQDVKSLDANTLEDFDLLIGGFPCQSFSISAQNPPRLGYKDERGKLFFEMVRILKEKKPRAFIAENVKGLLSANKGKAFPMIVKEFEGAGYHVVYRLLLASDYGVPQKRERVIIVGFRDKNDLASFTFPGEVGQKHVLREVIDETANEDEHWFFSDRAVAGMLNVREKMNKGRAQNLDEPCNTVSSHLAKVSLNSTDPVLLVGERYRRFTPREAASIQSFPSTFALDSVSESKQYKAIGNAVPPVMMWHVSKAVAKVLK